MVLIDSVPMQLADKVKIVKTLYDQVQILKAGGYMDRSDLNIIPLSLLEANAE